MTPTMHGAATLAVCLLYMTASTFAKPLTQLNSSDRLYYFGKTEVQDFELVSPQITHRMRPGKAGKHTGEKRASFEALGESFKLSLKPAEGLIDAGTLIHEVGKHGKTVLSQPTESCLYEGTSVEHKDSSVWASNCDNKFEASIVTNETSFQIQPLKAKHREKDGHTHIVSRRSIHTDACYMNAERPLTSTRARRKRSTTEPIYVEASVVADDLMYNTYGNNTYNYLLTILNQVAGLLKDSSLDVQVNLKISNIKIIKSPQPDLSLSEELDKSLESFCSWQKESKSDISILITRHDLISAGSHQVTGKTADVAGACDPEKRCLIGQDHGPSGLIFTLAHEIGHSLGMYHDGGLSDCVNEKNIMATVNSGGPEAFRWSECSNSDLLNFLDLPKSKCLKDKPASLPSYTPSSIPMPGFYYNATEQCTMSFNTKSTVASQVLNKPEICKALVCKTGKGALESTNTPSLDGTRCGTKRDICIHGECLKVYSTLDCNGGECIPFWLQGSFTCNSDICAETRSVLCVEQHDDGTTRRVTDLSRCPSVIPETNRVCMDDPCRYTFVSDAYDACSVTCESGVQTRNVYCVDRSNGETVDDALCTLTTKPQVSRVCNTGVTCSVTTYTFVAEAFGQCTVTCGSGIQTRVVTCQDSTGNVVIDALCTNINLVKPDIAQQCSSVDCITDSLRYIAGPLSACTVTCGSGIRTRMIYCVNGANHVVTNTECEAGNLEPLSTQTICELQACPITSYSVIRGQYGPCSVTCGVGAENRVVLCLDQNGQQVAMQNCLDFGLSDLATERVCTLSACPQAFRFQSGVYSDCTVTCGAGVRTRTYQCLDEQNQSVDIVNCLALGLTPPATFSGCTLEDCATFIYQYGEFGMCSEACGDGLQFRAVVCVNNDTKEIVADGNCMGERPPSTQPCNIMSCSETLQFASGLFAPCNCSGIQTRIVICISRAGSTLERVPVQDCLDAGLAPFISSQQCTPPSDCTQTDPFWQVTVWDACSVTCGVGTQTRVVYCMAVLGSTAEPQIVDDSMCSPENRPPTMRDCDTGVECPTDYMWLAYEWRPCSVTCGGGFESRDVYCFSLGMSITQVDDLLCNAGEKLTAVQSCSLDPCTASWSTSDWSSCSAICGPGTELRAVTCRATKYQASNSVDESECIAEEKPSGIRPCYLSICPSAFGCETTSMLETTVQYTESSPGYNEGENYPNDLDCNKGFVAYIQDSRRRRRRFVNANPDFYIRLTFTAFDLELSEDCQFDYLEISDLRYNTSERLCGNSYNLPLVWSSMGPHVNIYFHTDATLTRPGYSVIYQAVEKQEPARYEATEWSECSVTCGEGVEMRDVACYRGDETVADGECGDLQRPASTQPCIEDECIEPNVCSSDLIRTTDNSVLLSPSFPDSYPNNVSCINRIQGPAGMVVQMSVTFFNLRDSPDCIWDKVLINDFNSEGDGLVLCGSLGPAVIFTSITNEVVIEFSSGDGVIPPNGLGYSLQANFINEQGSPCGREIMTSGQAVYSPNYPGDYNEDENCLTVIRNDNGCIQILFLDIDLPPYSNEGECTDFVQFVDLNVVNVNTGPICGSEVPSVFYSATGLLTVRFYSDQSGDLRSGYNAVTRFVECTTGLWVTGPYGACSATCGDAVRSRTVACQDPRTMDELDPSMCPPERPEVMLDCDNDECPSCNAQIMENGQEIRSPNSPGNYETNQMCVTDIVNTEGCITITFLEFILEGKAFGSEICNDYVQITDAARDTPVTYCGFEIPPPYQSLSGNVQLNFITDDSIVYSGFVAYVTFNPCPVNAYIIGNWSECSVTCGMGIRTRDIQCTDLLNNVPADDSLCSGERPLDTEPCVAGEECPSCDVYVNETGQFLTSPGFPDGYAENLNCIYTFEAQAPSCVRLTLLEAYLSGPNDDGLCDDDYLEISSDMQPPVRYCPESARSITWYSRTNKAQLVFVTNEEESNGGFNIYNIFGSCPDYDFSVGAFSECSARCGGGVMTRDVTCMQLSNNLAVDDALCLNQAPLASIPCNEVPCPVCDESFSSGLELVMSPGFSSNPQSYETMLDCSYNITNPDGCLFLTLLNFDLQECVDCSCDSLTFIENGEAARPPLCGTRPVEGWQSQTGNVVLEFVTDGSVNAPGFSIHVAYSACPDVFFFTEEYSECDVSCGGGVQTREVYCKSRSTNEEVDESMCTGPKPPATQSCGEDSCPFCDEDITSPTFITSPNYPAEYPVSISCNYKITAPVDECITVVVLRLELEDSAECDDDFIELTDEASSGLTRRFCGTLGTRTIEWKSRSSNANLEFFSNEENTFDGFRAYIGFSTCPVYGYDASEFGMCSRPCGGGVQTRQVTCQVLETEAVVNDANCADERPSDSRPCNTEACPECNTLIPTERQSIVSLNFPQPYFEYTCNYLYTNPGGCVELLFVQFEMPEPDADGICDTDYLLVEDNSDHPFSYRICGSSLPANVVSRGPYLNVTLITDGNPGTFGEGYQLYNLFMDTCPLAGYVSGDWEECDRECGGGTRIRPVDCIDLMSGLTVDDSLCFDRRPQEVELCNSDPCPSCDELINTFPSRLQSPNYPSSFDPQRTCQYNITSSRCVRVNFLNFDLPPPDMQTMMCGDNFVQLKDLGAEFLMRRFCGDGGMTAPGAALFAWESRTGQVMITLNSGEDIPVGSGFNFYITETDCPEFGFVAGNFGECSTTCNNDGVRTRTVECLRLADNTAAPSEDSCMDPRPIDSMPCEPQDTCPSCDMFVNEVDTLIMAPTRDGTWTTNVNCQLTIELDSDCVIIAALELTLSEPDVNGACVDSSLTFSDGAFPEYTQQVCGSPSPLPVSFRALSNRFVVDFYSADFLNGIDSYGLYIVSAACPTIMYYAGEFSMCSASCGGGVRTRDVTCMRMDLNEEVPAEACMDTPPAPQEPCNEEECPQECNNVITANTPITTLMSPGRPTYVTDADCVNNIVNLSGCISIGILSIDIEAGSEAGVCDKDYLEIYDATYPALTVQLCGGTIPQTPWRSKSGVVRTRFVSDDVDTMQDGYTLVYSFDMDCPTGTYTLSDWGVCSATCGGGIRTAATLQCVLPSMATASLDECPGLPPSTEEECNTNPCPEIPEYYYYSGVFATCSATCGPGVQAREVECRRVDDDTVVADALCTDMKPETSEACNLMNCANNNNLVVNEPSVSTTVSQGDSGTIQSPNYPMNYPNNLNGELVLTIPPNSLLMIVIVDLDLVFDTPCAAGDSLRFASGSSNELAVCSNALGVPFTWYSMSGETMVTVTFTTSATNAGTGFSGTWSVFEDTSR